MKILNGSELVGYIKERQARQVRALRQADHIQPKLAIIQTIDDPVIDTYVALKSRYGEDILVDVDIFRVKQYDAIREIERANLDASVHGIIVQLPLADPTETDTITAAVAPQKDIDGLGSDEFFTPATPMAIDWLLAGYNINFIDKKIALVGAGRLVGAPLEKLWKSTGLHPTIFEKGDDLSGLINYDVIVTATGVGGLIESRMVKIGAIVVDAGTSSEHGKIVGDVAGDIRERDDLTITPEKGGVGPLTVAALFDNVIRAAREQSDQR